MFYRFCSRKDWEQSRAIAVTEPWNDYGVGGGPCERCKKGADAISPWPRLGDSGVRSAGRPQGVTQLAEMKQDRWGREAPAKAALVQFLRDTEALTSTTAVAVELGLAKQSNRADLVIIGNGLHFYEVKSRRDTLTRLEGQLASYEASGDTVTVVAASKHINTVLSRVSSHVGILEILDFGGDTRIRAVRAAAPSPNWKASAALELLPANELRARFLDGSGPKKRVEILARIAEVPAEKVKAEVVRFLRSRYLPTTKAFLRAVQRRIVKSEDLAALRIWSRDQERFPTAEVEPSEVHLNGDSYLVHVGKSFGPVPEEIAHLLKSQSTHSSSTGSVPPSSKCA